MTRASTVTKIEDGRRTVYIIVDKNPDGSPARVVSKGMKLGSEISGWLNATCILAGVALHHGVPWPKIAEKLRGHRFGTSTGEPSLLEKIVDAVDASTKGAK